MITRVDLGEGAECPRATMMEGRAMKGRTTVPFLTPPPGVGRLDHRASVNEGIGYWRKVAADMTQSRATRATAATLAGIHTAALVIQDAAIV